ncbi:MAG: hypothetical protein WDZ69_02695 [Candidatus Pacearchaeota archaeon]
MGLFSKKKEVKNEEAPSLPKLPKLPEMDNFKDDYNQRGTEAQQPMSRLPSYPSSSLGTKFSQDTIKEAVSGEKEDSEFPADDFSDDDDEKRMMQEAPVISPRTEEMGERSRRMKRFKEKRTAEPVFIRIDKFEEALDIFNESKKKISEIERVLEEIKKVREKEEKELQSWETEVKSMKEDIEKVDKDVFSKV